MPDPRTVKLAELLVNYSVEVQSGDWMIVREDSEIRVDGELFY